MELRAGTPLEIALTAPESGAGAACERRFTWRAEGDCTAWIWCRSAQFDPSLDVVRKDGSELSDDNGGGGTSAWIRLDVAAGETLTIRARGTAGVGQLQIAVTSESEATRDLAARLRDELEARRTATERPDPAEHAGWLATAAAEVITADPDGRSLLLSNVMWELAETLYAAGAYPPSLEAFARVRGLRERTLPPESLSRQQACLKQAMVMQEMGDVAGSVSLKREAIDVLAQVLPEHALELTIARANLASGLILLGEVDAGIALLESVLATPPEHLPPNAPLRTLVRLNLGEALVRRGDIARARETMEETLAAAEADLGANHPYVSGLGLNLALLCSRNGDCPRALELMERSIASRRAREGDGTLPVLLAEKLGVEILRQCGDLDRALSWAERTLSGLTSQLGPDDLEVLTLQSVIGSVLAQRGDHLAARDVMTVVLEGMSQRLPPGTRELEAVRVNLSNVLGVLGDGQGARTLLEQAVDGMALALAPDDPALSTARINLAEELRRLGDFQGALDVQEQLLASISDESDPGGVLRAKVRVNLSSTLLALGRMERAEECLQDLLEEHSDRAMLDQLDLHITRSNLAALRIERRELASARDLLIEDLERSAGGKGVTELSMIDSRARLSVVHAMLGDEQGVREQMQLVVSALEDVRRRSLARTSMREVEQLAQAWRGPLQILASSTRILPIASADLEIVRIDQALRELPHLRAAALRHALRGGGVEGVAAKLASLTERITQLAEEPDASAELAAAIRERSALERASLAAAVDPDPSAQAPASIEAIRARLGEHDAGVVFMTTRETTELDAAGRSARYQSLCAFVLRAKGPVARIELGRAAPIEALVDRWRSESGAHGPARGLGAGAVHDGEDGHGIGVALRQAVYDPLVPALDGVDRIHLTLEGMLARIPFDALPLGAQEDEAVLGDRLIVELHESLGELCAADPAPSAPERIVLLGDVDYASAEFDAGDAQSGGSLVSGTFSPLPATRREVARIRDLWHGLEDGVVELTRARASKDVLRAATPGARYVHLATHGWTAPEALLLAADQSRVVDGLAALPSDDRDVVRIGLSPMSLSGLALAGISSSAVNGRLAGALNAEELAGWDLSSCSLAVFSACDTALGIHQVGRAPDGLQRAARLAGARQVLCALWPVSDEATAELMSAFYEGLWSEQLSPGRALWRAKSALRSRRGADGRAAFHKADWAGWVLCGPEPRNVR